VAEAEAVGQILRGRVDVVVVPAVAVVLVLDFIQALKWAALLLLLLVVAGLAVRTPKVAVRLEAMEAHPKLIPVEQD
jgi:hypothetical protein